MRFTVAFRSAETRPPTDRISTSRAGSRLLRRALACARWKVLSYSTPLCLKLADAAAAEPLPPRSRTYRRNHNAHARCYCERSRTFAAERLSLPLPPHLPVRPLKRKQQAPLVAQSHIRDAPAGARAHQREPRLPGGRPASGSVPGRGLPAPSRAPAGPSPTSRSVSWQRRSGRHRDSRLRPSQLSSRIAPVSWREIELGLVERAERCGSIFRIDPGNELARRFGRWRGASASATQDHLPAMSSTLRHSSSRTGATDRRDWRISSIFGELGLGLDVLQRDRADLRTGSTRTDTQSASLGSGRASRVIRMMPTTALSVMLQ